MVKDSEATALQLQEAGLSAHSVRFCLQCDAPKMDWYRHKSDSGHHECRKITVHELELVVAERRARPDPQTWTFPMGKHKGKTVKDVVP